MTRLSLKTKELKVETISPLPKIDAVIKKDLFANNGGIGDERRRTKCRSNGRTKEDLKFGKFKDGL